MPERDSTHHGRLDDLNFATGEGGSNLGNSESVHSFNGNLQIVHATSPGYPVDGGGQFGLVRTYNSNAVVCDDVYNNGLTVRGVSWAGLGWKMHMGRFFSVPEYEASTTPKYKKKRYYFETPTGALIDVVWEPTRSRYKYQTRPAPEIYAEYFPDCGSQLPPACDDGLTPPCDDNVPAPLAGCPERSPEDQGEHYRVIFPGGTVYKLEKRASATSTPAARMSGAKRATRGSAPEIQSTLTTLRAGSQAGRRVRGTGTPRLTRRASSRRARTTRIGRKSGQHWQAALDTTHGARRQWCGDYLEVAGPTAGRSRHLRLTQPAGVSNGNPLSVSQFMVLKYHPGFPHGFDSYETTWAHCRGFFTWYGTERCHSGLAMLTPETVHRGRIAAVNAHRQVTLDSSFARHAERSVRQVPRPREPP